MKIPNLGQNMFVPRQENILDGLFNMFGSIFSGSMAADAADSQTAAQLQANYEQIAAQREESEKAFKRNSSIGQKAQLMAAGLSEQQAMQVIAGNAMHGEYQPAEIGNAMEGVDLSAAGRARADAAMNATAGFGSAVSELGKGLYDSIRDPEGGNLGAIQGTPLMNMISENLSLVNRKKVHTFADFENWVNSLPDDSKAGKVFKPMLESKEFKKVKRFSPAQLFCTASFGRMYTAAMDSNQAFKQKTVQMAVERSQIAVNKTIELLNDAHSKQLLDLITTQGLERDELIQRMQNEVAELNLINEQILGERWNNSLKELNYKRENALYDVITEATKMTMLETAAEAYRNWALYDDEDYITTWVQEQYMTEEGKLALAQLEASENQDALNKYSKNRFTAWLVTMHNLFKGSVSGAVTSAGASAGGFAILLKAIKALPK